MWRIFMKKTSSVKIDKAIELYNSGRSLNQIGKELDIDPYGTLSKILKRKNIKIINKQNTTYHCDFNFFDIIDNEKKSYWLGFLYADAYVAQHKRKDNKLKSRLEIGLHIKDTGHLEKFQRDIHSNHKLYCSVKFPNKITLEINNKNLCSSLIKHGCHQKKSFTIQFPVLRGDLIRHFIRGFFDGDGSVYKCANGYWGVKICSASPQFLVEYSSILTQNEISNKIAKGAGVEIIVIKTSDFIKFFHFLYDDATTFMDRKIDKYRTLVSERQRN
jgi:hypothetical protein